MIAAMSAGDLAAVVVTILGVAGFVALVFALQSVLRSMRAVHAAVEELHDRTFPLVADLHGAVREAGDDLDRLDDLLGTAESISAQVEGASRLAASAISGPVIKTVAFATGTSRAAKRFRRQRSGA